MQHIGNFFRLIYTVGFPPSNLPGSKIVPKNNGGVGRFYACCTEAPRLTPFGSVIYRHLRLLLALEQDRFNHGGALLLSLSARLHAGINRHNAKIWGLSPLALAKPAWRKSRGGQFKAKISQQNGQRDRGELGCATRLGLWPGRVTLALCPA